nr:copper amine oxidase N-terminal domain-containing protein [uncultured Anaerotignum sp.]
MKKNMTKVMAMGMVLTMLAGTTAFASGTVTEATKGVQATAEDTKQAEAAFLSESGKIVSVEKNEKDGSCVVEITNKQGGLRFAMDANSLILDRKTGGNLKVADLTEGMEVAVIYEANSPMGMSLPPYLGNVTAVVANADADNMMVGHFGEDLTDRTSKLQLNISDETRILNLEGAKIRLSAEDIKNQDALVFYDVTTKSLPAQTTPSLVLLLTQTEETQTRETQTQEMVPLREAAVKNGYTVKWQGKQKPILLEKEGTSIAITIGSDEYVVEGDMVKKAAMPSELKNGKTYVSSDIFA